MLPKTLSILSILGVFIIASLSVEANSPAVVVNENRPALYFDFEQCASFLGGHSADYSEFTAQKTENPECGDISIIGGHPYRINPNRNSHSCAPGNNETVAMCISAGDYCQYIPGEEKSLMFEIYIQPGPSGTGSLDNISFFSRAPEMFNFIQGESGLNNYPTRFRVRVISEEGEIFRSSEIKTSNEWTMRRIDFNSAPQTTVTEPTLFRIEILPYCLIGNGGSVQAWDIDDLVISAGCSSVDGGTISTDSPNVLCSVDTDKNVNFDLEGEIGTDFQWVIVNKKDTIVALSSINQFDFENLEDDNYRVFHLAYEGDLEGLEVGSLLFNIQGCYDLSNPLSFSNFNVAGGMLSVNQSTSISICPNSQTQIINTTLTGNLGELTSYVLVNADGTIVAQYAQNEIDLSSVADGIYNLYAVSYGGAIGGLAPGMLFEEIQGCFEFSNAVEIFKSNTTVVGGNITSGGSTEISLCSNTTTLQIDLVGNVGSSSNFIIVNRQGRIVSVQDDSDISFGNLTEPGFSVYHISFENAVAGLALNQDFSALAGCFDLSNELVVNRDDLTAGTISSNGFTSISLCYKNDDNQAVSVELDNASGGNSTFLITDDQGEILEITDLPANGALDFSSAAPGICLIWHLVYLGTIEGLEVGNNANELMGACFALSNSIEVVRQEVESGVIDGPTSYDICLSSTASTALTLTVNNAIGDFQTWIVTDQDGGVLETNTTGEFEFGNAPQGICQVYHLAHTDENILFGNSENVNDIVLGCFELSDPVVVTRTEVESGSLAVNAGLTRDTLFIEEGQQQSLQVDLNGSIGMSSTFVVTDTFGVILFTQSSTEFTFTGDQSSVCEIIHMSSTGPVTGLSVGEDVAALMGCFDLSNVLTIVKIVTDVPDPLSPAEIEIAGVGTSTDICLGDSSSDSLSISVITAPQGNFQTFIITDDLGEILELTTSSTIDFDGTPPGVCRVYHVAYNLSPLAGLMVGENISGLSGDFALSNFISVNREEVDGGALVSGTMTTVRVVVGDADPDTLNLSLSGNVGDTSLFLITDMSGRIMELPVGDIIFDGSEADTCFVWNISYLEGLETIEVGNLVADLEGCYALSNPVRVIKELFIAPDPLDGGSLSLVSGAIDTSICLNFSNDPVNVNLVGAEGDSTTYVVTDTFGLILDITQFPTFNFNDTPPGVCLIWNLSFNGTLTGLELNQNVSGLMGEFDLSNSVVINRDEVDGGSISTSNGQTEIFTTVGDGIIDSVDVNLTDVVGDSSVWLITDASLNILEFGSEPPFAFEDQDPGTCLIWHISYNGTLTGLILGGNVAQLNADCFDVSNSIVVNRIAVFSPDSLVVFDMPEITGSPNDSICIPVIVSNFDSIDTFGGSVVWDSMVLEFIGVEEFGVNNFSESDFGTINSESGEITFSWIDQTGMTPQTLVSGDTLFAVCFRLIGEECDTSQVTVFNSPTAVSVTRSGNLPTDPSIPLNIAINPGEIVITSNPGEECLFAGTIETAEGLTAVNLCLGDVSEPDSITVNFEDNPIGPNQTFVVTDNLGSILELSANAGFNFGGTPEGTCFVYHLVYSGMIGGLTTGSSITGLTGNFELSNRIEVVRDLVAGGVLTNTTGLDTITITVSDAEIDTFNISVSGAVGDTTNFIVTDEAGNILEFSDGQLIFDAQPAGTCIAWNISYAFGLEGLEVSQNVANLQGCFALSNPFVINREVDDSVINGGVIATTDGLTTVDLCIGENGGTIDLMVMNATGPNFRWVLTDTAGIVSSVREAPTFTIINDNIDTCLVWHVAYDSTVVLQGFGFDIDTISGNFDLSNPVVVAKTEPSPGFVMLEGGNFVMNITTGDTEPDTVNVISGGGSLDTTRYILTDQFGVVSIIQDTTQFIFTDEPSGTCFIYEVSFGAGFTGLEVGANINLLSGCFSVSNSITINKMSSVVINGGSITSPNGTSLTVCQSDPGIDSIMVSLTGQVGSESAWIITNATGLITALPSGPPFAFENAPLGSCDIWHISYENPIGGLSVGLNVSGLTGNFDLSNNINVTKESVQAGILTTATGLSQDTIIINNIPADSLFVSLSGTILGDTTSWVVTDTFGNIILLPEEPPFTFEQFQPGVCQLWHMSYSEGLQGLQLGNTVPDDLDGCFDFSDPILVVKEAGQSNQVDAGTISLASGGTTFTFCAGNVGIDSTLVNISGQSGPNFSFVITNQSGGIFQVQDTVQSLQSSRLVAAEGNSDTLLLYHVSFETPLTTLSLPFNINSLTGIYDISNPITLVRQSVSGAFLTTTDNTDIIVGEGTVDLIDVTKTLTSNADSLIWMVYDSTGVILELDSGPPFSFESYGDNRLTIVELAFNFGTTGIEVGNNISEIQGCFDFSNGIEVTTTLADLNGGTLLTTDSLDRVDFCFNSGYTQDSVDVILSDTLGMNFSWVISDTSGLILDLPMMPPFGFDNMDPSILEIRNISYDSTLVGLTIGEDLDTLSGEFLFSNVVTVNISNVNGGTISTPTGETEFEFCVGDGVAPSIVNFSNSGTVGDTRYVVVDTNNTILALPLIDFQDFEGFGNGECRVYNISFNEELLGLAVGQGLNDITGCFELSSNFLTVDKIGVDANIVLTDPVAVDNFISFCVADGQLDSLTLSTNSTMGDYIYVITDTLGVIDSVLVGNVIDFEGSSFGMCRIYGISYTGTFIGEPGDTVGVDSLSTQCYDIVQNPILVDRQDCSDPIINEVYADQRVEIKNQGTGSIDISDYYLCGAGTRYARIGDLNLSCGDLVLAPGELVVIELTGVTNSEIPINSADDELALYRNNLGFGNSTNMIHYVEWGTTGHARSNVAVIAGLWLSGQFAPAITTAMSLKYDGDGIMATDWSVGMPTECMDNLLPEDPNISRLSFNTFPNPFVNTLNIDIEEKPNDEVQIIIFDSFGREISQRNVQGAAEIQLELKDLGAGVYYLKVTSGRAEKMERIIKF